MTQPKPEYKYPKFAPFNDHPGCKGHGNAMLDMTYENEDDRKLLVGAVEHYIVDKDKPDAKSKHR